MSRSSLTRAACVAFALASSLAAQLRWEVVATATAPAARYGHACNHWGLVFGGRNGQQLFNDSWLSIDGSWQQLTPAVAPPGRIRHGLTATVVNIGIGLNAQVALMFGGEDLAGNKLGDTWRMTRWVTFGPWGQPVWHAEWQQSNPAIAPSPRSGHAMSHGYWADEVLLFGGETAPGLSDETWLFSAGNWKQVQTQIRPPARRGAVIVADAVVGYRMFGGSDATGPRNDCWTFDGSQWRREADLGFSAAHIAGQHTWRRDSYLVLASDVANGGVQTSVHERTPEGTWLTQAQAGVPLARAETVLLMGDEVLVFGGRDAAGNALGDTRRLVAVHPASNEWFGSGCGSGPCNAGPLLNVPELRLGRSISCGLQTAGTDNFGAFVMQLGKAEAAAQCELSVAPQFVHAGLVNAWGGLTMPLAVPQDPMLRGLRLSMQAVALPLTGSSDGFALSPGIVITIGD